jgi:hypothetical protein
MIDKQVSTHIEVLTAPACTTHACAERTAIHGMVLYTDCAIVGQVKHLLLIELKLSPDDS